MAANALWNHRRNEIMFRRFGFHLIFFQPHRCKLLMSFKHQTKAFMLDNNPGELWMPQMCPAKDWQWLKIIASVLTLALIIAGGVAVIIIWNGAT